MDRFSKITLQNDNITTTKFNGSNFGKKPFPYRLELPIHVEEKTLYKLMFFFKELVINRANIDETGIRFPDEQSNNVSLNSEELSTFLKLPKQASNATKGKKNNYFLFVICIYC